MKFRFKLISQYLFILIFLSVFLLLINVAYGDTDTFTNNTGIYDGYVQKSGSSYSNIYSTTFFLFGNTTSGPNNYIYRSYAEFNISDIPTYVTITDVKLNVTLFEIETGMSANFTRFNNTHPSTYGDDETLFDDIQTGYNNLGNYLTNINPTPDTYNETIQFDLGNKAVKDLQSQIQDTLLFSVGFLSNNESIGFRAGYYSEGYSNENYQPKLIVTYTEGNCDYSGSGNWLINTTCNYDNEQITVYGNLTIGTNGFMNMTGDTNVSFSGADRYTFIEKGGEINIYDTAGFNK